MDEGTKHNADRRDTGDGFSTEDNFMIAEPSGRRYCRVLAAEGL